MYMNPWTLQFYIKQAPCVEGLPLLTSTEWNTNRFAFLSENKNNKHETKYMTQTFWVLATKDSVPWDIGGRGGVSVVIVPAY